MNIIKSLVPASKYELKCPYIMVPEFFVIHNTSGDASAKNEIAYMKNNNLQTSFHFAVDDVEVRQGIPIDRNAFHAGDGSRGAGNRKGIGVEICYSKSGGTRFEKAEERAAEFVAEKLIEFGWGIGRVKKHQDFSGKYCPHRTLDLGWERFLRKVELYVDLLKRVEALEKKTNKFIYAWVDDNMPEWAKPTITKLMEKGYLKGDEEGNLNLDENMLRMLVINDRAGLYD